MELWWNSLTVFERVAWSITIPVSIIFVLQSILTFAGIGGHHFLGDVGDISDVHLDIDAHFDGDVSHDHGSLHFFNFRNFINFFLGFGWSLIALENAIANRFLLVIISCFIGVILVAVVMSIFYMMAQMTQSGTMDLQSALGKTGEVYLTIPAGREGVGKVQITVQGTLRELDAMTGGERIQTGQWIKVIGVVEDQALLVESIANTPQSVI